jgi:hypothetical protein
MADAGDKTRLGPCQICCDRLAHTPWLKPLHWCLLFTYDSRKRTPNLFCCSVACTHPIGGDDNLDTLKVLLARKPKLDIMSKTSDLKLYGNTVLHNAAESAHIEAVRLLLGAKCDPTLKNAEGKTAMDLAFDRQHLEVLRLLDTDQADKCEVMFQTKRAGNGAVCGWLRASGAPEKMVLAFKEASITGKYLIRMHGSADRLASAGVTAPEEVEWLNGELSALQGVRDNTCMHKAMDLARKAGVVVFTGFMCWFACVDAMAPHTASRGTLTLVHACCRYYMLLIFGHVGGTYLQNVGVY